MKQIFLSMFLALTVHLTVSGQTTTITLTTGSDWTDATLIKSLKSSESSMASTNYNNYPKVSSTAWNHSGSLATHRNLLKFDLTTIPIGTTVQSATLYFYSDPANTSGEFSNSGSNSIYIQKVTQVWTPTTVTWNNQPTSTTTGRVTVAQSASTTENITVDITALVQGMVNSPTTNYGLLLRLATETASRSRNYASTNHTNSALHPKLVIVLATPPSISNAWKDGIETIFQNVNRSYVSTGFLADYGIYMTNLEKFSGIPSDSNYIEYDEWQALYTTLFTCRFNANSVMTEPSTMYQMADTLAKQNPGMHMIMGMHYRYDRFRDDAVSANLVYVSNNKIYDTPGRTQLPYEQRDAFAMVPDISVLQDANHTFLFKPQLFYGNSGKTISTIQFDAGDGLGYRTLTFNSPANVTYSSEGVKTMRFKITYTDNSFRESRTKVLVENIVQTNPAARTASSTVEFNFPLAGFPSPQPFKGKVGKALVTVAYGNPDNVIKKPFIVLEGFDPSKITGAENYSFEKFMGRVLGIDVQIDYTYNDTTYTTLKAAIQGENFDIIFVDFGDGTDYIERNAYLVENIIAWVNSVKQPNNGVLGKNIVMGASMGGLVGRYALRDIELTTGTASHDTKLFMTLDTPHQGVNLLLGLQGMITHWAGKGIGLGVPGITYTPSWLTFGSLNKDLGKSYQLLNSPAARQMLLYSVVGSGDALIHDNSIHDAFYKDYTSKGWPTLGNIRNVTIASGSECGTDQGFQPHTEFVNSDEKMLKWGWQALFNLLAPYVMPFTSYPQAAIPIPLTTSSHLKQKIVINALPNQTGQRVYYGKMYIKKKILFLINVNITLFENEVYSRPAYLPLDGAPGGKQDMNRWQKLPFDLKQDKFCFVPVFSSIDIGGGTQTITYADVFRSYSPGSPSGFPKNARATNFFTNPTIGGVANEIHPQVTKHNGIFAFKEMLGLEPTFSCGYACPSSTGLGLTISGNSTVCSTATPFTLSNTLADSIVWSNSPNLNYISGQNTNNYAVAMGTVGNGFVKVSVFGACGTAEKQFDVWAGKPSPPGAFTVTSGNFYDMCVNSQVQMMIGAVPGAASYNWMSNDPTGLQVEGDGTSALLTGLATSVNSPSGFWTFTYSADNTCGSNSKLYGIIINNCTAGGGGQQLRVAAYPNPAATSLNIQIIDSLSLNKQIADIPFQLNLYDKFSQPVYSTQSTEKSMQIPLNGISNDVYYLVLQYKEVIIRRQIIVKH